MNKITEKKLKDKRFRRTENAVITALLTTKDKLSLGRFIRIARISRSTLHRHHGNLSEIVPNYEAYLLRKWKITATRLFKIKSVSLKFCYERLLSFLSAHRQIVELLLKYDDHIFIEQLILALKTKILTTSKTKNDEIFRLYAKEVAGLIETWCQAGFIPDAISTTVAKITYLTDTVQSRLGPLSQYDRLAPIRASKAQRNI